MSKRDSLNASGNPDGNVNQFFQSVDSHYYHDTVEPLIMDPPRREQAPYTNNTKKHFLAAK